MSSATPKPPTAAAATATDSRPLPTQTPSTTTATNTTKTLPRPQPQPQLPHLYPVHHAFHQFYPSTTTHPLRDPLNSIPNPNPNPKINPTVLQQGIPYPFSSSGRGFVTRPLRPPDPAFNARPAVGIAYRPPPATQAVADPALPHLHQLPHRGHQYAYPVRVVRQVAGPHSPGARQHPVPSAGAAQGPAGGNSQAKAAPPPSPIPNSNGFKSSCDRSREDSIITVCGRKVRVVEEMSLYALCRSWVQNGQPEDRQPEEGDTSKPLPRPIPLDVVEDQFRSTREAEDAIEDEDEDSVVDLSPKDLLNRHIKRAKKVRARLREERQKRIERYKSRLALLLPPQVDQHQNDTAAAD